MIEHSFIRRKLVRISIHQLSIYLVHLSSLGLSLIERKEDDSGE